jgi:co-chaperonin GroES (HSP10)
MSETIALPPQGFVLPDGTMHELSAEEVAVTEVPEVVEEPSQEEVQAQMAKQLPEPRGWRILCSLVTATDQYDSGLLKADETKKIEELTSPVLFVLKLGDLAYKDADKFPMGPWCKEGDFVITRPYTGTRIMIYGKEFRVIYDDQVEAVVEDPRGITRA